MRGSIAFSGRDRDQGGRYQSDARERKEEKHRSRSDEARGPKGKGAPRRATDGAVRTANGGSSEKDEVAWRIGLCKKRERIPGGKKGCGSPPGGRVGGCCCEERKGFKIGRRMPGEGKSGAPKSVLT